MGDNVLGEHIKKLRARKNSFENWGEHIKQEKWVSNGNSTNKKRALASRFLHLQSILHMLLHFLLSMLLGRYLRVLLLKAGFHSEESERFHFFRGEN